MKKQKSLKRVFIVASSVFAVTALCHCGTESTENAVARQDERDKVTQRLRDKGNKKISGVFSGTTPTSDIFLTLENTKTNGGLPIPMATIAGSLVVSPKLSLSLNNERVQYVFPFSDGVYDPLGGDDSQAIGRLAFTLEKDGRPSNVSCAVNRDNAMNCTWNVSSNTKFSLKPVTIQALSVLASQSATDYVYVGSDQYDNVMVEFESDPISKDNSRIPDPSIAGSIVFFKKSNTQEFPDAMPLGGNSGFRNGTYDIIGGKITVTMDEDSKITMVCKILKAGAALDCKYHSRSPRSFLLFRTVRK